VAVHGGVEGDRGGDRVDGDARRRRSEIDFDPAGSEVAYRDGDGNEWRLSNDQGLPGVMIGESNRE